MLAAISSEIEAYEKVKILLKAGADPNKKDGQNVSPLLRTINVCLKDWNNPTVPEKIFCALMRNEEIEIPDRVNISGKYRSMKEFCVESKLPVFFFLVKLGYFPVEKAYETLQPIIDEQSDLI